MKHFFKNLNKVPLALSGASLGFATIGNAWTMFSLTNDFSFKIDWIKYITISFAIFIVLLMSLKYIFNFRQFIDDFKNPTLSNFIPTILMTSLVISDFFRKQNLYYIHFYLWIICVSLQIIYIVAFIIYHFLRFNINNYIASWFIPPIGIIVACVCSENLGRCYSITNEMNIFSQVIWWFGLTFYILMLPIMIYKYNFTKHLSTNKLPAYGIMAAPPNLLLAGYLTTFTKLLDYNLTQNIIIISSLTSIGIFFVISVYISMVKVFRQKFEPLFACYTFPLAICSVALLKLSKYLWEHNLEDISYIVKIIALIQVIIASLIILYVLTRLIIFTIKNIWNFKSKKENIN